MQVIHIEHPHTIDKDHYLKAFSVAFGNFDGLHLGHQQVITKAIQSAKDHHLHSGVMTFHPHPKEVLGKEKNITYLTPLKYKLQLLEQMGVEKTFVVRFTERFANLTPTQFIEQYIVKLHVKQVVTGFDFCFGHRGYGTIETLTDWSGQTNHFKLHVIPSIDDKQQKISSSRVRKLLQKGEMEDVTHLLKRNYSITGSVIHGEKRGQQIGFPTANIGLEEPYVIPKHGVYAVRVIWNQQELFGVLNIGIKPTFHSLRDRQPTIEVHLFDFHHSIYDHDLKIQFIAYLREEKKFTSVDELKAQITQDMLQAKQKLKIIS